MDEPRTQQNEPHLMSLLTKLACSDNYRLDAMQEELNQFERNQVWEFVPKPIDHPVIGTRWVF
ncbi:hypothetical protein ACDT16_13890 [Staphylococcus aureus]